MPSRQIKAECKAIREMERACLSKDSKPTTTADVQENGEIATREYFGWLKQQAPVAGMLLDFDRIVAAAV